MLLGGACIAWYLITIALRAHYASESQVFSWYYDDLIPPGAHGAFGIVKGIVEDPGYFLNTRLTFSRFLYIFLLLAPFLFSVLIEPLALFAVIPGIVLTTFASDRKWELYTISFQYVWYVIPGATLIFILFVKSILNCNSKRLSQMVGTFTIIMSAILYAFFGAQGAAPYFRGGYRNFNFTWTSESKSMAEFTALAKAEFRKNPNQWIVCSGDLCSHLLEFPNIMPCRMWWPDRIDKVGAFIGSSEHNCLPGDLRHQGLVLKSQAAGLSVWVRPGA